MNRLNIVSIFLLLSTGLFAQNDVQYTHFMFNKMAYNPAYAGNDGALSLGAIYRHQWIDIDGAPRTFHVNGHMPFAKDRCGIGLSLTTDKIGMAQTNFVDLYYSYRIPLGNNTLSIGLNGRVEQGRMDFSKAQGIDPVDGLVSGEVEQVIVPNFGTGIMLSGERFFAGLSVNQLLNNSYYQSSNLTDQSDLRMRTVYLMGGINLPLGSNVRFQPSLLVSHNPSAPFDLDINAGFTFMNRLFTGLSYRLEDSADLLIMYQATNQLKIGASYDFIVSDLSSKTAGSFECLIQYVFRYDNGGIKNIRYF